MATTKLVPLHLLRASREVQQREKLNDAVIDEYAEVYREHAERGREAPFPPLDVFHDGERLWVADGFHRYRAAMKAQVSAVRCCVHTGTKRDARIFACGANAAHGLRRTAADIKKAILTLLADAEWASRSLRDIASHVKCSHQWVAKVKDERDRAADTAEAKREAKAAARRQRRAQAGAAPAAPEPKHADARLIDHPCPNCASRYAVPDGDGLACDNCGHPIDAAPAWPATPASVTGYERGRRNMETWNQLLSQAEKAIEDAFASAEPSGTWWGQREQRAWRSALKRAVAVLQSARGRSVCVACGGDGCRTCRNEGFVVRGRVKWTSEG